jgi:DNA-binding response OmpR family regulator
VCDGIQAWEALQAEGAPQLAILDWNMPGLDGVEVCRKVRETAATKSIYLILLTARGDQDDLVAALAAGANDYLSKPFKACCSVPVHIRHFAPHKIR